MSNQNNSNTTAQTTQPRTFVKSAYFQNSVASIEIKPESNETNAPVSVYITPMVIKHLKSIFKHAEVKDLPEIESTLSHYQDALCHLKSMVDKLPVDCRFDYTVVHNKELSTFDPFFRQILSDVGASRDSLVYGKENHLDIAKHIFSIIAMCSDALTRMPTSIVKLMKEVPNPRLVEYDHSRTVNILRSHGISPDLEDVQELSLLDQSVTLLDVSFQTALVVYPVIDFKQIYTALKSVSDFSYGTRISYRTKGADINSKTPVLPKIYMYNDRPMMPIRVDTNVRAARDSPHEIVFSASALC